MEFASDQRLASRGAHKSDDLTGDMFVSAFNTADYSANQFPEFTSEPATIEGMDTSASSPEQMIGMAQDTTPGSGMGASSTDPKLNPRSCVTCRKRKVRCDKREPCSNCSKASIECVFPPPGRAPRKPRRPQDAELLKRLRRLESVVDSLGASVDEEGNPHPHESSPDKRASSEINFGGLSPTNPSRRTSLEHGLGRLLIKQGRSRYVSNEFWSSLGREIADIRNDLDSPSSGEDQDPATPEVSDPTNKFTHHQGFLFGYSSLMYDMTKLHPNPSQIFILWEIYKENVDPVMKILHVPTVKNIIMKAAVSASTLSKESEALFYSICLASAVSMNEDQCEQLLGQEKDKLMHKYRFAVEQSLARAGLLNSSDLMVLQAFVLFLIVVKYIDTSRSIGALNALAMHHAQAQGLHRDGSNFKLLPFDVEMRRRLWWHISLQTARAVEDYGADPCFSDPVSDTRLPLNVNDDDIWPEMTETPAEQPGASDMTFTLVRFELGNAQRKLRVVAGAENDDDKKRHMKEKEELIDMMHAHMQERYYQYCDPNSPLLWVASTVGKLILAKMWLFVHHPRLFEGDAQVVQSLNEQVFTTSVEVAEFGMLLQTGKNTSKWSWLFKTYMQWHAVAFVLSELTHMPPGPQFDRGWNAVASMWDRRMVDAHKTQRSYIFKPLKQLYARVKARRDQFAQQNGGMPGSNADSTQSVSSDSPGMPNLVSGTIIGDNWLDANPHNNAVPAGGIDFGLDFNDPIFNGFDMAGAFNFTNGFPAVTGTSMDGLPYGWTPGVNDYLGDLGGQNAQPTWQPQMQSEWH